MTAAIRAYRHRRLPPYAAAFVALATLGGCTGSDPAPATTPPPVTTPTATTTTAPPATTTPTPTVSVDPVLAKIPAQALKNDRNGAIAFAQFYFKVLNRAFQTGDTQLLSSLATKTCITCTAFVQGVDQLGAKGQRYGGDLVRISSASAITFSPTAKRLLLEIDQAAVPVLNKSGSHISTTPPGKASFVASVDFNAGRWSMTRLQKAIS